MPKQSEIDRMIVLLYHSNNAHDYTNFVRPAGWLDGLPMAGLEELARMFEVMREDVDREVKQRKMDGIDKYSREYAERQRRRADLTKSLGIEFK